MPIEKSAPELDRIVSADQEIEELGSGYGGDQSPAEGPVWWKDGGYLLFSDIHNNRRMKWAPGEGVTLFKEPTDRANGLTRDQQGRLVAAEHDSRRVTRTEHDGSTTVIANSFKGRQLNRPNDVVVKSDGCIYFTDPWTMQRPQDQWDLDFSGVYRVTPDLGRLTLLVNDFVIPDGMKVDVEGNVYCGGSGGVWVMDPSGKHLGTIVHGQPATTNIAWGDDDWKTLYITSRNTLMRIRLNIPGLPVPAA